MKLIKDKVSFMGGVLVGLFISVMVLGFLIILEFPPGSGVVTYQLEVRYSEHRINENITVSEIVPEGFTTWIILELNISRCYRVYWGDFDSKDNSGTVEKDLGLGYTKGFYVIPLQITRETYFRLIWQPNSSEFFGYHIVQCNFIDT